MPGSSLRILHLYPKGDFFTGAAIQLRDLAAGLAARPAAQAMACAGRKRVEAHFSLRAKLDATEALYRRLVDMRGAA